jgi:hypothetical protein
LVFGGENEMTDEAFVESEETPRRTLKSIKLPVNEDGSINWDAASAKHTQAFIDAIKADPNGILKNIQEEAGQQPSADSGEANPTGIADASVLAAANGLMIAEALLIAGFGHKIAPPLKSLHPVVAIKACAVTMEEMQPVMPECKRIMKRYIPVEYLGQEYQDIAIVGQHLIKLSMTKFKACVDLAMEIEKMKASAANKPNGHANVVIDAEPGAIK